MNAKYQVAAGAVLLVVLAVLVTNAVRATQPALTVNVVSRAATNDVVEYIVGLTNRGQRITYVGYAKDLPTYRSISEGPSGRITNMLFWCGTGMTEHTLSHNEGVQFKLQFAATNGPAAAIVNYTHARWFDRVLAHAPNFIRAKLPGRDYRCVEVRLTS